MARKKTKFQPLATEIETVAAAVGLEPRQVTSDVLRGLVAGLAHTSSPLKDAAEHLLSVRDLAVERRVLLEDLQDMLNDEAEQIRTKSAMEPIVRDEERWRETIEQLENVMFRLV